MSLKTDKWKIKIKETRAKRKSQSCKVFSLKFDKSRLSTTKSEYLRNIFLEAKWLYNYILSQSDVFEYDTKSDNITSLDKDKNKVDRTLMHLSSQMKQAVKQKLINSIKSLSAKKKKGVKVGKLKYKSRVCSLVLNQYNITYKIIENKFVKLQGCDYKFKVLGFKQIPKNAEFANATLTKRNGDYYFKLTCFLPKEEKKFKEKAVGLDFNVKQSVVLSNGEIKEVHIPETKRLKILQRRYKRKVKDSKNWGRLSFLVRKEHTNIVNRKTDAKNKIVSYITNKFEIVCFQDENIKGWHSGLFGKQIQHSCLGGIIRDLKTKSHTPSMVDRFYPSTQLCPVCGKKNKLTLSQRVYVCECGYKRERDLHSANNNLDEGLRILKIPREPRELKPVENLITTVGCITIANHGSMNQEAPAFRQG